MSHVFTALVTPDLTERKALLEYKKYSHSSLQMHINTPARAGRGFHGGMGRARCEVSNVRSASGLLRIADGDFHFNRLLTWQQWVAGVCVPRCNPVTARVLRCQPTLPIITREEETALAPLGRLTNKLIKKTILK